MHRQNELLEAIAKVSVSKAKPPGYTRDITEFPKFNWPSIDAKVIEFDDYGPTIVEWNRHRYYRRSPENNFGTAIFFSRSLGKKEDGGNNYERLITFKPKPEVTAISRAAEAAIG